MNSPVVKGGIKGFMPSPNRVTTQVGSISAHNHRKSRKSRSAAQSDRRGGSSPLRGPHRAQLFTSSSVRCLLDDKMGWGSGRFDGRVDGLRILAKLIRSRKAQETLYGLGVRGTPTA
eukprot:3374221-Pyramimonas_sp.AAC.1